MDLKTVLITALLLHFLKYAVIAQGGYYNEEECKLLPTQNGISSQFHRKASEKGVKMVYLNLKFGNNNRYPLPLQGYLADIWVWADKITEPMLSLPDDLDILSLGLLNYQVRSMDVHLEDQPSGCLATLNSTLLNMAVGRMLLENVTTGSSANQLSRETEVVCAAMIREDRRIVFRCCNKTRRINQPDGPSEIQCDLTVEKIDMFRGILIFVCLLMIYYLPAFPLVLPDCIFSLQYECDKEDRAEAEQMDSDRAESDTPLRNGYEQIAGARDGHAREEKTGASEIPVDDSSPVTCSALLRAYIQKLPELRLSFNIKLAVMFYWVLPCVVYVQVGLWLALQNEYLHKDLFHHHFTVSIQRGAISGSLLLGGFYVFTSLPFVLFLRPKHFLFRHDMCPLCKLVTFFSTFLTTSLPTVDFPARKSPDSIGNEILFHLRRLRQLPAFVWSAFEQLHTLLLEKLLSFCTCSLSMVNHHESRLKRALCVLYELFTTFLAVLLGLFGVICLNLLLLIVVVCLLTVFSPILTLLALLFRNAVSSRNRNGGRVVMAIFAIIIIVPLVFCTLLLLLSTSASFVIYILGFIMIGLYLNVDIVTPYVAFFIVVTTNIYLCYANLQNKYREFKELLLKYRQKTLNISNGDQDTISTSLFWFVSDRVLPIATEIGRTFCHMALITIFLYLFLSWVLFFKDTYSISAAMSAVSVFVSGVIPGLFFRGITKGKVFVGWEKIKMKREIEIAVEEFDRERNDANIASGGMGNLEMRYSGLV